MALMWFILLITKYIIHKITSNFNINELKVKYLQPDMENEKSRVKIKFRTIHENIFRHSAAPEPGKYPDRQTGAMPPFHIVNATGSHAHHLFQAIVIHQELYETHPECFHDQ